MKQNQLRSILLTIFAGLVGLVTLSGVARAQDAGAIDPQVAQGIEAFRKESERARVTIRPQGTVLVNGATVEQAVDFTRPIAVTPANLPDPKGAEPSVTVEAPAPPRSAEPRSDNTPMSDAPKAGSEPKPDKNYSGPRSDRSPLPLPKPDATAQPYDPSAPRSDRAPTPATVKKPTN